MILYLQCADLSMTFTVLSQLKGALGYKMHLKLSNLVKTNAQTENYLKMFSYEMHQKVEPVTRGCDATENNYPYTTGSELFCQSK